VNSWSALCEVRNCEFFCGPWYGLGWTVPATGSLALDNCLFIRSPLLIEMHPAVPRDVSVRLSRNTWVGRDYSLEVRLYTTNLPGADRPIRLDVSGNVFQYTQALAHVNQWLEMPLGAAETEVLTRRLLAWDERRNAYPPMLPLLKFTRIYRDLPDSVPVKGLARWRRFWGLKWPSSSSEVGVRFAAPDLEARLADAPEKVVPEDFRLHRDSPGKGLGADVRLVGPGLPYDRWRKTPEYRQWQKRVAKVLKGG
jgi:hypothetical protein